MIDRYAWRGGSEAMLRFGPDTGPVVIAALPLFEEANRTRAFMVAILRQLGRVGIAALLPDLPGTGESLIPTANASIGDMREAFAALVAQCRDAGRRPLSLAIRSGALLDGAADVAGRWHLAPQGAAELARELDRVLHAAARESGEPAATLDATAPLEVAGNLLSPKLQAELLAPPWTDPAPSRTVRLASDPAPADIKIDAAPLWRRAEPENDSMLAALLAGDVADWVRG